MNILVLHSLGNPALAPAFLNHHVFALRRNCPQHNYLYHDAALPLPQYVIDASFDAIILDVSFLTARWASPDFFGQRKFTYQFLRESNAVKLAFPQDEYDCSSLLDDWMCDWKIDVVFSVISSRWDILYPKYSLVGQIKLGYTGYIDESLINRNSLPFEKRSIDIGYRARKLPPYFGRLGQIKWTIGRDVVALARKEKLNVDIDVGESATLYGEAWFDFISDSKFTLGSNSGSSLLDPIGHIQKRVRNYLKHNPNASFDMVEAQCFPNLDGINNFTAISPRVLEAALLNSAQILVTGEYSGVVQPGSHFIEIAPDASNFSEVLEKMADISAVTRMINQCREAVLSVDALRYNNKSKMVIDLIKDFSAKKGLKTDPDKIAKVIHQYKNEMNGQYKNLWKKQYFHHHLRRIFEPYPRLYEAAKAAKKLVQSLKS